VIDERDVFEKSFRRYEPEGGSFERLVRRRDRKRRNQRIAAGVVGIAVFVLAVWIVTAGGAFDRTQTPAVPGPAETGPAETAPPSAPASAAADVVYAGMCSDGARWRLELTNVVAPDQNRIKVRFEVYQSPVGHSWRITLSTTDESNFFFPPSRLVFRGIRVASDSGDFAVQDHVPQGRNVAQGNVFWAKAVDTQTGQVCTVKATIFG
jgi:hypothetical protein